jgi:hypothetical protein
MTTNDYGTYYVEIKSEDIGVNPTWCFTCRKKTLSKQDVSHCKCSICWGLK